MNPLVKILTSAPRELNCIKVDCPEIGDPQFIAELSGIEMSEFTEIWGRYRDEESDDTIEDYKRAAVAFCWCDEKRERFAKTYDDVREAILLLKDRSAALTRRLFEPADVLNCFVGVEHSAKKSLLATLQRLRKEDGNGGLP